MSYYINDTFLCFLFDYEGQGLTFVTAYLPFKCIYRLCCLKDFVRCVTVSIDSDNFHIIVNRKSCIIGHKKSFCTLPSTNRFNTFSLRRYRYIPSPKHPSQPDHYQSVERKRPDLSQDQKDTHGWMSSQLLLKDVWQYISADVLKGKRAVEYQLEWGAE